MSQLILNFFLTVHISILVALSISFLLRYFIHRDFLSISAKNELFLNHLLMALVIFLPLIAVSKAESLDLRPMTKTSIARTYQEFDQTPRILRSEKINLGSEHQLPLIPIEYIRDGILVLMLLTVIISILQVYRELKVLNRLKKNAVLLRSLGKVRIAFSEEVHIPFSFLSLNAAWAILPSHFALHQEKIRMSLAHELQHHRQGDTTCLFILQGMRAICGMNPALYRWIEIILEIQELKVDKKLVDHGKVKLRDYARCLIEVAETAITKEQRLVSATGFAFLAERHQLKRRLETMFKIKRNNPMTAVFVGGIMIWSMTALALTTGKMIGSRTVSMVDAEKMVQVANQDSKFPIVINDLVLEQLNRYIGTDQGRDFMRKALRRLQNYQPMMEKKLKSFEFPLPVELMAIPIVESGYQNLLPVHNPVRAAGIWQMIKSTAKNFGLKLTDGGKDERMIEELETKASLRYLYSNYVRFGDWQLSILAFNMGEQAVQKAMDAIESRDPWEIIRAGYENDNAYLAKVMAAIIIMKNPSSVE